MKDYKEQQRKVKDKKKPLVMSDAAAVESDEGAPYHCLVNKVYHNEER